ncbi:hypothetical protein PCK2_000628 [Pneumocystis canis]|nr:hypothetical protein PCK2_000628 [Pneumocystis canis]
MDDAWVMCLMNGFQALDAQLRRIANNQEETMAYLRSKDNVSTSLSKYKEIYLYKKIQAIPKYTTKVKHLREEIHYLQKQVECLHALSLKLYHQKQDLSERWKMIKQNEQQRDRMLLKAPYIFDEHNPTLPAMIIIKRDASKVRPVHIEE